MVLFRIYFLKKGIRFQVAFFIGTMYCCRFNSTRLVFKCLVFETENLKEKEVLTLQQLDFGKAGKV